MDTYNAILLQNPNEIVNETESIGIETWVWCFCHNLRNKELNYADETLVEDLQEQLNDIVTHSVVLLVNEFRNIQLLADLDQGINHAMTGANPLRKSESKQINIGGLARTSDSISFNNFNIMQQQGTQMSQAHKILQDIYKEIQQMIYNYTH